MIELSLSVFGNKYKETTQCILQLLTIAPQTTIHHNTSESVVIERSERGKTIGTERDIFRTFIFLLIRGRVSRIAMCKNGTFEDLSPGGRY